MKFLSDNHSWHNAKFTKKIFAQARSFFYASRSLNLATLIPSFRTPGRYSLANTNGQFAKRQPKAKNPSTNGLKELPRRREADVLIVSIVVVVQGPYSLYFLEASEFHPRTGVWPRVVSL